MTSTTPRIITIALAILALAVPAASAMPTGDNGVQTSSLAGTSSAPKQDVRNPDNRAPGIGATQDLPNADNRVPAQQPQTMKPVAIETQPVPVKDDGPSPLVFILPSLALIGMLAAATLYARSSRQPARA
jgi:hypothetical protein